MYDGVLIELHKENAPNILLEDFNYFANKAINQYINKHYNIYDVNQQTTDDLRVLKANAVLTPHKVTDTYDGLSLADLATYYVDLPTDYLHLLNCICIYNVKKTYKCYNAGDTWRAAATRLTADAYSQVLDNFWTKPSYKRPYYYIHNINTSDNGTIPTNPYNNGKGTDLVYKLVEDSYAGYTIVGITNEYNSETMAENDGDAYLYNNPEDTKHDKATLMIIDSNATSESGSSTIGYRIENVTSYLPYIEFRIHDSNDIYEYKFGTNGGWLKKEGLDVDRNGNIILTRPDTNMFSSINIKDFGKLSTVERSALQRYGNASRVRLEIRFGTDTSVFTLDLVPGGKGGKVYIDYIKSPLHIRLTQEEVDYTEDKSQVLEFPDYVCQEILNELVHLVMENISDLRLQTHPIVSLSIANPTQQLAPEAAGQSA